MTSEYLDYLESLHWAKLREAAFCIAGNRCEVCRSNVRLNGHHLVYRNPLTDCTTDDVMALCERCHNAWHNWLKFAGFSVPQFCRLSTRGAIQVLIFGQPPPKSVKPPKVIYCNSPKKKIKQKNPNRDPEVIRVMKELDRVKFLEWVRAYYVGARRSSLIGKAMQLHDKNNGIKRVFHTQKEPRIEDGVYRIS